MGSVSSINPGLADLFQTLSNVNSPVLSSPAAVSALEKASPADIAQLSIEASQLEGMDALFGVSASSDPTTSNLLESVDPALTGSSAPASGLSQGVINTPSALLASTGSTADQVASYQTSVQAAEAQTLLGTGPTGSLSDSLFDLIG